MRGSDVIWTIVLLAYCSQYLNLCTAKERVRERERERERERKRKRVGHE